jgi:hypothetical protein
MPTFVEVDNDKLDQLIQNGGLAKGTLRRRELCVDSFREFVTASDETLEGLIERADLKKLDRFVANFFMTFRVKNKDSGEIDLPKKNTIDGQKSHLKCEVLKLSKGRMDMYNNNQFPLFTVRFLP